MKTQNFTERSRCFWAEKCGTQVSEWELDLTLFSTRLVVNLGRRGEVTPSLAGLGLLSCSDEEETKCCEEATSHDIIVFVKWPRRASQTHLVISSPSHSNHSLHLQTAGKTGRLPRLKTPNRGGARWQINVFLESHSLHGSTSRASFHHYAICQCDVCHWKTGFSLTSFQIHIPAISQREVFKSPPPTSDTNLWFQFGVKWITSLILIDHNWSSTRHCGSIVLGFMGVSCNETQSKTCYELSLNINPFTHCCVLGANTSPGWREDEARHSEAASEEKLTKNLTGTDCLLVTVEWYPE